jgi:quercetin dioxygenase-like cupin family protein
MDMRQITIALCAALMMAGGTFASAQELPKTRLAPADLKELKWAVSATGSSQAAILGDPTKPGIYVVYSKFPAGMRTPVHFHPDDRVVTVVSGAAYVGYGDTFDEKELKAMPTGSVYTEPSKVPHYNWAKDGELLLLIVGHGPSGSSTVPAK